MINSQRGIFQNSCDVVDDDNEAMMKLLALIAVCRFAINQVQIAIHLFISTLTALGALPRKVQLGTEIGSFV